MAGWYAAAAVLSVAVVIAALYRVVGDYLAWVYTSPRDGRVERVLYRVIGVDPQAEQTWQAYLRAVLAFSLVSVLALDALQRLQGFLPRIPGAPGARRGAGLQHRDLLRDEHELAVLLA